MKAVEEGFGKALKSALLKLYKREHPVTDSEELFELMMSSYT